MNVQIENPKESEHSIKVHLTENIMFVRNKVNQNKQIRTTRITRNNIF